MSDEGSRLSVRRLAPVELGAVQSLAYGREWFYPDTTWRLLFDIGEVHGVVDDEGSARSLATLVRYGSDLAWIGMMITDPRHEGRGLGRQVMERLLERAGDTVTGLYATSRGRPLYEKLDFVPIGDNTIYLGRPEVAPGIVPRSRPATPADLPDMLELDRRATGVDRSDLVVRLFGYADQLRVVEDRGRVTAYGGAWRNADRMMLGPILATDPADVAPLLDDLAATARGPARLEVADDRPELSGWASRRGLAPAATITIMTRYGRLLPGDRDMWYAPVSLAFT